VFGDNRVLARHHRAPVQRPCLDALKAKLLRFLQVVPQFGVEQQGLGRNASHKQASPAQPGVCVNERDLQPILRSANRRRVARRPSADHCHVVNGFWICLCQGLTPFQYFTAYPARSAGAPHLDSEMLDCKNLGFPFSIPLEPGWNSTNPVSVLDSPRTWVPHSKRPPRRTFRVGWHESQCFSLNRTPRRDPPCQRAAASAPSTSSVPPPTVSASSPNAPIHCTSGSRRNHVICRFA